MENRYESELKAMWCEIFKNDGIGLDENFFELGGDSLKAIILLSQVKEKYGVELEVSELFENQTIRTIAALIKDKKEGGETA